MENYTSMFESGISAGAVEKLPEAQAPGKLGNTISSRSYDIGRSCEEMHGERLRFGKQNNSTVTQSRNSMY